MSVTIGVDVGGTKIAAAIVDEKGVLGARTRRETPAEDTGAILDAIVEVVQELSAAQPVEAVGIGAAGFVAADRSTMLYAPNLSWRDLPLGERVSMATGLRTVVENDANAAAWGEFRFGAGEDVDDMVLLIVGTGVGGGIISDGTISRGAHGIAGEVGHMRIVPGGQLCGCGLRGCVEAYASGTALVREARAAAADLPSGARLLELAGGDPRHVDGPMVTRAATEGDELATVLIAELGHWLGEAMASLGALVDPAVFVIGGGVSAAGELLRGPADEAMRRQLSGRGHRPEPEVRLATGGNDVGLIGAADLARV